MEILVPPNILNVIREGFLCITLVADMGVMIPALMLGLIKRLVCMWNLMFLSGTQHLLKEGSKSG